MIQAIESIRREVVVPVSSEQAFEVFTSGMTGWWPKEHHIGSAPIEQIVHRVYDEAILEVPRERAEQRKEQLLARMRIAPTWAPGLPLDADGAVSDRWGKD